MSTKQVMWMWQLSREGHKWQTSHLYGDEESSRGLLVCNTM